MENEGIGSGIGAADDASQTNNATTAATGIRESEQSPQHLTVIELAPLAIGKSGKPARRVTLTCELPEAIADHIRPGMIWNGQEWLTADGQPVEMRELSTA